MTSERGGVYGVSRAIWDDPDFADEPFTEREAWLWLIGAAAWRPTRIRGNHGHAVDLDRGEFSFSVRYLAERWRWSKSAVDRFFGKLEKRDMIECAERDTAKVYFIRNYNKFQIVGMPERDSERDTNRDASGTEAGQKRRREEGKNIDSPSLRSGVSAPPPIADVADPIIAPSLALTPEPEPSDPIADAVGAYNEVAEDVGWPSCQRLTPQRGSKLKQRLAECGGIDGWRAAMARARASPFLRGETGNDRSWRPNLDFFLQQSSFTKLMEGTYDDRKRGGQQSVPFGRGDPFAAALAQRLDALGGGPEGRRDDDSAVLDL